MPERLGNLTYRRVTTADSDRLVVLLDGAPVASIDLMAGASPAALDALTKLGLNLEEVLAAEWTRD